MFVKSAGSHNSKCIKRNNNIIDSEITGVKIVQEWNGIRPKINPLLKEYHLSLAADKIRADLKTIKREEKRQRQQQSKRRKVIVDYSYNDNNTTTTTTAWIECLLQTGIEDFRKNAVDLILAPYLINTKKLSTNLAAQIIRDWLYNKCKPVSDLEFDAESQIKKALTNMINKPDFRHMSADTLRKRQPDLYRKVVLQ